MTYILVLATNHRPETDVPAETVAGLTGVNLLKDAIFIYTNILGVAVDALLARLGLPPPVADCRTAILSIGDRPWRRTFASAGRAGNAWCVG